MYNLVATFFFFLNRHLRGSSGDRKKFAGLHRMVPVKENFLKKDLVNASQQCYWSLLWILILNVFFQEMVACLSELGEREQHMERELAALRLANREREADLATLTAILQSNHDIINVRL